MISPQIRASLLKHVPASETNVSGIFQYASRRNAKYVMIIILMPLGPSWSSEDISNAAFPSQSWLQNI